MSALMNVMMCRRTWLPHQRMPADDIYVTDGNAHIYMHDISLYLYIEVSYQHIYLTWYGTSVIYFVIHQYSIFVMSSTTRSHFSMLLL